jgi:hypothetical protein
VLAGASGGRYHGGGREIFLVDKASATGRCNGVAHKQSQKTVRRANQDGWAMFGARHASSAGDCFHSEATPGRGLEGARPMTQHHCLQQMHRVFDDILPASTASACTRALVHSQASRRRRLASHRAPALSPPARPSPSSVALAVPSTRSAIGTRSPCRATAARTITPAPSVDSLHPLGARFARRQQARPPLYTPSALVCRVANGYITCPAAAVHLDHKPPPTRAPLTTRPRLLQQ